MRTTVLALGLVLVCCDLLHAETSAELRARMDRLVVPHWQVQDVPLEAALTRLQQETAKLQPEGEAIPMRCTAALAAQGARLTMEFNRIPLFELLRFTCMAAGADFVVLDDGILLGTPEELERDHDGGVLAAGEPNAPAAEPPSEAPAAVVIHAMCVQVLDRALLAEREADEWTLEAIRAIPADKRRVVARARKGIRATAADDTADGSMQVIIQSAARGNGVDLAILVQGTFSRTRLAGMVARGTQVLVQDDKLLVVRVKPWQPDRADR